MWPAHSATSRRSAWTSRRASSDRTPLRRVVAATGSSIGRSTAQGRPSSRPLRQTRPWRPDRPATGRQPAHSGRSWPPRRRCPGALGCGPARSADATSRRRSWLRSSSSNGPMPPSATIPVSGRSSASSSPPTPDGRRLSTAPTISPRKWSNGLARWRPTTARAGCRAACGSTSSARTSPIPVRTRSTTPSARPC